jgi:hypothetical protein
LLIALNTYDPVDAQEGALDPLGLNPIADRLGNKLTPGIRERMQHPRFLTAVAVGAELCRNFNGEVAKDGITSPQMVFEWYVVQALYKTFRESDNELSGMPGKLKAREAWIKKDPFSHTRYLKTAPTFGFNGVYKTLADELDIVSDGILGENGDHLLRVWSEEQNLVGFYGSDDSNGIGRQFKNIFRNAIIQSMEKGEVAHPWNWHWFQQIAEPLAIYRAGKKERAFISSLLMNNEKGYRQPLLENLPEFLKINEEINWTEKQFHEYLLKFGNNNLNQLLQTVLTYEQFVGILNYAFYDLLYYLSDKNRKVQVKELQAEPFANPDIVQLRNLYESAYSMLTNYNESIEFEKTFGSFASINSSRDFIVMLIDHHKKIQKNKPPFGKAPWIEPFEDGSYMIRPLYRQDDPKEKTDEYVNRYRIYSLISFLNDLKKEE